jgi:hypothetical protein
MTFPTAVGPSSSISTKCLLCHCPKHCSSHGMSNWILTSVK